MVKLPADGVPVVRASPPGAIGESAGTVQIEMTVREYADRERVDDRTVWRWLAKGAVPFRKTPGGGIRVVVAADALTKTDNH